MTRSYRLCLGWCLVTVPLLQSPPLPSLSGSLSLYPSLSLSLSGSRSLCIYISNYVSIINVSISFSVFSFLSSSSPSHLILFFGHLIRLSRLPRCPLHALSQAYSSACLSHLHSHITHAYSSIHAFKHSPLPSHPLPPVSRSPSLQAYAPPPPWPRYQRRRHSPPTALPSPCCLLMGRVADRLSTWNSPSLCHPPPTTALAFPSLLSVWAELLTFMSLRPIRIFLATSR